MQLETGRGRDARAAVRALAATIGAEHYPSGQLAQLRRLRSDMPGDGAFWRLLLDHVPEAVGDRALEEDWAVVLCGMAIMVPYHRPEADDTRGMLGEAMALADVSELRVLRLLRVARDRLPDELIRLARLMASRGRGFDWAEAVRLLRTAGTDRAEGESRRVARDYYHKLHALERAAT